MLASMKWCSCQYSQLQNLLSFPVDEPFPIADSKQEFTPWLFRGSALFVIRCYEVINVHLTYKGKLVINCLL